MVSWISSVLLLLLANNGDCFAPSRGVLMSQTMTLRASSQMDTSNSPPSSESLPPGRPTPRFFGFLFDDTLSLLNPKTMGSYQVKRKEQYGNIFKTNIFFGPTAVMVDKATVKELANQEALKKDSMDANFPPHHQKLFGPESLIVQSGAKHAQLRRLVQPSLSPMSMKSFQPTIDAALTTFIERLTKTYQPGTTFAIVPELRGFFIEIALNILLGTTTESATSSSSSSAYSKEEIEVLASDITTWSDGLLSAPLTFIPWSTAARAMRARKRIVEKLTVLIEQERENPSKNSLLGRLCAAQDEEDGGTRLSTDAIIDNTLTLIFAGSDTTASAATSLWMTLSQRPDLKKQIQSNPDALAPKLVSKILQMYPPAPFQMRILKQDIAIGDYTIPSGWMVMYGFAGALHQSNPSPDWLEDEENATDSPSSSMAFGSGPRMCPGRYLASLELTMLCRKLVNLDWSLEPDQDLEQRYTPGFFPKDNLQINFS